MTDVERQTPTRTQEPWPLHAIQLADLKVVRLLIEANPKVKRNAKQDDFSFETAHTPYNADKKSIGVRARVRIGFEETESGLCPYRLEAELVARFKVDDARFPTDCVEDWAQRNAPLVLYPYLREHALSLTVRGGFDPVLLPLLTVPTFRVTSAQATPE